MRRAQLEHELVFLAEVNLLQVLALMQVPEVQLATILALQQHLGDQAVLERLGRAPLAGHQRVMPEVPPHVIGQLLRAAVDLPAATHLEGLVVHEEHTAGGLARGVAQGGNVDALRSAVHGMRAGIPGPVGHLLRRNHFDNVRMARVWLDIQNVDARGPQARHDEVPPLDVGMRRVRA